MQTIFKSPIFSRHKRWGKETCNQSECPELIHTVQSFQNGGNSPPKRTFTRKRFPLQTGSKRRLFLYSNTPKVQKVLKVSLAGKPVRVSLHVLLPRSSTTCFHKTSESPNCIIKKDKYTSQNLVRRHVVNGSVQGGINTSQRNNNLPFTTARVSDKQKEISANSSADNRVSGSSDRFQVSFSVPTTRQGNTDHHQLQQTFDMSKGLNLRTCSDNRDIFLCCTSSSPRETSAALPSIPRSEGAENAQFLQCTNSSGQEFRRRVEMVEGKSLSIQWQSTKSFATGSSYSDRCIESRLGCTLPENFNRGELVLIRIHDAYKCFGDACGKTSSSHLCERKKCQVYSFSDRQHNGICLSS